MTSKKDSMVKIKLYLYCYHGVRYQVMKISVLDSEVPSYSAKCPECGKEVLFDFDGGLAA